MRTAPPRRAGCCCPRADPRSASSGPATAASPTSGAGVAPWPSGASPRRADRPVTAPVVRAVAAASPGRGGRALRRPPPLRDRLRRRPRRSGAPAIPGSSSLDARQPAGVRGRPRARRARACPHADDRRGDRRRHARRELPHDALLVTYCWGPHCNGATRAAARARRARVSGEGDDRRRRGLARRRATRLATASVVSDCISPTNAQDSPGFA